MRLPAHAPPRTQSFTGVYPVRFEGAPNSPFEGDSRWRGVPDFEHATLCRIFQLDPARFFFDLPSTIRGIGPNTRGSAVIPGGQRRISGFVMLAGRDTPVAKLSVCFDSERFTDRNPFDDRDFFDLNRS